MQRLKTVNALLPVPKKLSKWKRIILFHISYELFDIVYVEKLMHITVEYCTVGKKQEHSKSYLPLARSRQGHYSIVLLIQKITFIINILHTHLISFFCTGTCICHSLRCKIAIMGYFITIGARQHSCQTFVYNTKVYTKNFVSIATARSGPAVVNNVVATPLQTFNMLP